MDRISAAQHSVTRPQVMSALQNLERPTAPYNVEDLSPRRIVNGRKRGFETKEDAAAEDVLRAKMLTKFAAGRTDRLGRDAADVAERLAGERPSRTLASARFMREMRIRFTGSLLKLAAPWPDKDLRLFTALSSRWEIRAKDLKSLDPSKLREQLRSQLNRAGPKDANGFLIAVFEAEFEPVSRIYRFHAHGLVAGEMIDVLEKLHALDAYTSRSVVWKPLQVNKLKQDKSRAEAFSYLLKSYWRQRRLVPVADGRKPKRQRNPHRLDEPHHTKSLLFIDKFDLSSFVLLMKCECKHHAMALTNNSVHDIS
jgi:hypothetical protein